MFVKPQTKKHTKLYIPVVKNQIYDRIIHFFLPISKGKELRERLDILQNNLV